MPSLTTVQRRALSAAAGVVGRPRLHAGLLLALSVACGSAGDADPTDDLASTGDDPGTTTATTAVDPAVTTSSATDSAGTGATTSSGSASTSSGDASTASDDPSTSSDATTSSGDPSTSGGTLLTDASTTTAATTGATDTGETTGAPDTDATTGGLDDCLDPRTQEVDWACCEAQNWEPFPQCTPWGPPAPPTATRDLLTRARAARRGLLA
jgi:hypothetical protein